MHDPILRTLSTSITASEHNAEGLPLSIALDPDHPGERETLSILIEPQERAVMLSCYNAHGVHRPYSLTFAEMDRMVLAWNAYRMGLLTEDQRP